MPSSEFEISDDEEIYRRIPESQNWFDKTLEYPLSPQAFRPRPDDTEGLSVSRESLIPIEDFGRSRTINGRKKNYYVAVFRAGDLRKEGLLLMPDRTDEDPGHTLITNMTYENRKENPCQEWQTALAQELCIRVEGPFP